MDRNCWMINSVSYGWNTVTKRKIQSLGPVVSIGSSRYIIMRCTVINITFSFHHILSQSMDLANNIYVASFPWVVKAIRRLGAWRRKGLLRVIGSCRWSDTVGKAITICHPVVGHHVPMCFLGQQVFTVIGIVCSIADHITTNIPFTCYHLYGRNLQTKRHEISDCRFF